MVGEPTEGALRTLALKAGVDDADWPRLGVVPFESANKFMVTLNATPRGDCYLFVKGAPDRLLDRSATQARAQSAEPIDRSFWEARIDELSGQGLRVLAAARRRALDTDTLDIGDVDDGLEFLGLVGIVDPPRPEAITSIASCHAAGIRVKMITGDHAGTASAIAREMGIIKAGEEPRVLTGAELEAMSQTRLREVTDDVDVYARTSPEHKLRIVSALQAQGKVVAMTGDGVNDAPALTRADIGVAMGIKGTEATKEAAGIVLADDNFATIERAVEEGRRIYDNIRKSVLFMLPTNGAQSLIILVAILIGFALPLQPVQILWVNMVTSVTLSLALVFEKAEDGLMARPPRAEPGIGDPSRPRDDRVGLDPGRRRRHYRVLRRARRRRFTGRGADRGGELAGPGPAGLPAELPVRHVVEPATRGVPRKPLGVADGRCADRVATRLHVRTVHARLVPHGTRNPPRLVGRHRTVRGDFPARRGGQMGGPQDQRLVGWGGRGRWLPAAPVLPPGQRPHGSVGVLTGRCVSVQVAVSWGGQATPSPVATVD